MRSLFGIALALIAGSGPATAAGPVWPITDMPRFWVLGEGNTHLSLDGTYFHTKENFDENGEVARPAAMDHVRLGQLRFHIGHGFTPRASIFAQADLRGVFMQNFLESNISDDENYGLGDGFVGLRWLLHRSKSTDRIYPTEWAPETWIALAEATWLFPIYGRAETGKPPMGDQSNDFTLLGRIAWYANDWLGLSANAGYTYRTSGYEAVIPWGIRADLNFLRERYLRFWLELQSQERINDESGVLNPDEPDPIPSGSLLFKSDSPTIRMVNLGAAYQIGKEWELAAAGHFTASGMNYAKGFGGSLGLIWRPYQMPELTYEDYRKEQIRRLQREPRRYRQRPVARYGFQATVLRVSEKGNFFRIGYGQKDGVRTGDTFQVYAPDDLSGKERYPLAVARVQVSRESDSFLRVEYKHDRNLRIQPGYEVRRVIFEE